MINKYYGTGKGIFGKNEEVSCFHKTGDDLVKRGVLSKDKIVENTANAKKTTKSSSKK